MRHLLLSLLVVCCAFPLHAAPPASQPAITWEKWSDDIFERAKREKKFVLLDLEAVWCHWCHVMDETTYHDEAVLKLMRERYIAVRVDQDSRPDLSNRYEDYGWPATIVFAADGSEIVKRQGYLPPRQMASMLKAIIDDPTPGPSIRPVEPIVAAAGAALPAALREQLVAQVREAYDHNNGGWGLGGGHKFIDADVIEFCLASGDTKLAAMARQTLAAGRKLIDPAWGGVHQYSTDGDWDHPHFEKIMSYQADDLRTYARASVALSEPAFLKSAQEIHRYLRTILMSPEGAFYTSQDADLVPGQHSAEYFALPDAMRRKLGVPRVDTHVYARENGWAIEALVALYGVTGDEAPLAEAVRAAEWIIAHRSLDGGGFRHDERDAAAGPYLGDTLAMGRAFLALHTATAQRTWLTRAEAAATFIAAKFGSGAAGYATAAGPGPHAPLLQIDENVSLARFANLLYAYSGKAEYRAIAERAMKYLASPQVAGKRRWMVGGILLADRELATEPLHLVVVGKKGDPTAAALYRAALTFPSGYKRVEWYDRGEGPLARMDVEYPELGIPAAFLCTGGACSSPMFTVEKIVGARRVSEGIREGAPRR
jgi:uncharacterized protein YyaL (SSP411 family)